MVKGVGYDEKYKRTRKLRRFIQEIKPGWFLMSDAELRLLETLIGQCAIQRYVYRKLRGGIKN
jgi:hypothetical protein